LTWVTETFCPLSPRNSIRVLRAAAPELIPGESMRIAGTGYQVDCFLTQLPLFADILVPQRAVVTDKILH
jgi:hypothetical protein